jgi:hypothetical protein
MPTIEGGNGQEPFAINYGENSGTGFIYPSHRDIVSSGRDTLEIVASQHGITVDQVIEQLKKGISFNYTNKRPNS